MFFVSSTVGLYWIRNGFFIRELKFDDEFSYYNRETKISLSSITAIKFDLSSDQALSRHC